MASDLALIDRARKLLSEAKTVSDASKVHTAARMAEVGARRMGAFEAERDARDIRLRAERLMGEYLLSQGEKRGGAKSSRVTLPKDVSRNDSHKWQRVAQLNMEVFESELAKPEATTAALLKVWRKEHPKEQANGNAGKTCTVEDLAALPEAHYGTVYADPPWDYGNQATRAATSLHYATMDVKAICALPVARLAAKNAHCHLWTTNGFLRESFDVLDAWGFEYRSCFVWCKKKLGIGNYWRVSHEFMLLGIRGSAAFRDKTLKSWAVCERAEHSTKPEAVRQMVRSASPGPYLELFGRKPVEEWTVWGNQIDRKTLRLFS